LRSRRQGFLGVKCLGEEEGNNLGGATPETETGGGYFRAAARKGAGTCEEEESGERALRGTQCAVGGRSTVEEAGMPSLKDLSIPPAPEGQKHEPHRKEKQPGRDDKVMKTRLICMRRRGHLGGTSN